MSDRYARQLALPEWSPEAQTRLRETSAVVVGAGALGSAAATYLVCAGVGQIGIVDHGVVEVSDLQAAPLHFTPDVQTQKAESAAQKLGVLNIQVTVEPYPVTLDEGNAAAIVAGAGVVLDCSNTPGIRYLLNDACCAERVPLVWAGGAGFAGALATVRPGHSACLRCAFPRAGDPPAGPFFGAAAGVLGSLQALEALKLAADVGEHLGDRVLRFDGLTLEQTFEPVGRRPDCSACAGLEPSAQSV